LYKYTILNRTEKQLTNVIIFYDTNGLLNHFLCWADSTSKCNIFKITKKKLFRCFKV